MDRYSENIILQLNQAGVEEKYDQKFLSEVLFKVKYFIQNGDMSASPVDLLTARLYVFSQLLTEDERSSMKRENYLKDPDSTHRAVRKFSTLLADELEKLSLLDEKSKKEISKHWYNKKINEILRMITK